MSSYVGIPSNNPTKYLGPNDSIVSIVTRNRAPTSADIRQGTTGHYYPIGSLWIVSKDPTTGSQGDMWYLSKIVANVAYWGNITPTAEAVSLTGNDSVVVVPDVNGNINVVGSGSITTAGTTNTETISLTGLTNHNVLVGAGTSTITKVSPSTATFVLTSNGVSADPSFQAVSASGAVTQIIPDSGTTISPLAGQILVSGGSTGMEFVGIAPDNLDLSGVLQVDNGGTNATSFTAYSVICGGTTSTGTLQNVSGLGSSGQVLTSNGASALPSWGASAGAVRFSARKSANSTNATGDGTSFNIICDTVIQNTGSGYNGGTGVFTAPSTGLYIFICNVDLTNLLLAHTTGLVNLGTQSFDSNPYNSSNAATTTNLVYSQVYLLNATDTVALSTSVSGGTKTVTVQGGSGNHGCFFSGFLIG